MTGNSDPEKNGRPEIFRSIPINDLNDVDFILVEPLQVEIEIYTEEVIAKIPELDLWASSSTESESLLAMKKCVRELWDDLEGEDDQDLGNLPQMWKRILNRKLRRHVRG